jgi:hypothetical protein
VRGKPRKARAFLIAASGENDYVTVSDSNPTVASVGGGIAAFVFRGFIPGFRVAYFSLQLFGGEMRLLEGFFSGVGQVLAGRRCKLRRFLITHPSPPIGLNGISIRRSCRSRGGDTERHMKLLNFLVESFVGAFGITRPKPEQQRTVALALGGFLLVFFTALISLILWMLFGQQR